MTSKITDGTLAMVSIPVQTIADVYTIDSAIEIGTIFPDLNKPFHKGEPTDGSMISNNNIYSSKPEITKEKKSMLYQITCVSFALDDLTLYLDTHPDDQKALNLYKDFHQRRENLIKDFSTNYYPLNRDSIECNSADKAPFNWNIGPMPWEGGLL